MFNQTTLHHRNEDYTYRLPQPPKISIPGPMIYEHLGPLHLGPPRPNTLSFDMVCFEGRRSTNTKWNYQDRRVFTEVLSYLYLGPSGAVNEKLLSEGNHSLLIGLAPVGISSTMLAMRLAQRLNLPHHFFPINNYNELPAVFPRVTEAINKHVEEVGWIVPSLPDSSPDSPTSATAALEPRAKILLFCESGIDYSAAACSAYLMETFQNVNLCLSMQICVTSRFSCHFSNTVDMLDSYQQMIIARDDVMRRTQQNPSLMMHQVERKKSQDMNDHFRRKRDRYLHNIDDEVWEDNERFDGRSSPQPFNDVDGRMSPQLLDDEQVVKMEGSGI